jgi:hypothetical protein
MVARCWKESTGKKVKKIATEGSRQRRMGSVIKEAKVLSEA